MRDLPEKVYIDRGPRGGLMFRDTRMPDTIAVYVPEDRIAQLERELASMRAVEAKAVVEWAAEKALADRLIKNVHCTFQCVIRAVIIDSDECSCGCYETQAAYRKAREL